MLGWSRWGSREMTLNFDLPDEGAHEAGTVEAMSAKVLRKLWADPGVVRTEAGRARTCG